MDAYAHLLPSHACAVWDLDDRYGQQRQLQLANVCVKAEIGGVDTAIDEKSDAS